MDALLFQSRTTKPPSNPPHPMQPSPCIFPTLACTLGKACAAALANESALCMTTLVAPCDWRDGSWILADGG
ncbi:hypothetical protein SVAN01_09842 [Stagonosporopsis vannaccii]|nr:hypothetical protein SVAN01_09842 [Stagonosporopsis vannaccii]